MDHNYNKVSGTEEGLGWVPPEQRPHSIPGFTFPCPQSLEHPLPQKVSLKVMINVFLLTDHHPSSLASSQTPPIFVLGLLRPPEDHIARGTAPGTVMQPLEHCPDFPLNALTWLRKEDSFAGVNLMPSQITGALSINACSKYPGSRVGPFAERRRQHEPPTRPPSGFRTITYYLTFK